MTTEKKIVILGGTGFIGSALVKELQQFEHPITLVSRNPETTKHKFPQIEIVGSLQQIPPHSPVKAVINLAGAGIGDARWTPKRKELLQSSRVETTKKAVSWALALAEPPEVFIQGSAMGYYGTSLEQEFTESTPPAQDFLGSLCQAWEEAASPIAAAGIRLCYLRTSLVFGQGGALDKISIPFRLGLGGPVGTGNQWMTWVHLADEVGAIIHLLNSPQAQGAFNLSAGALTNKDFSQVMAQILGKPAFLPLPGFVLKILLGELSLLSLQGQRLSNRKLLESGYQLQYPEISPALEQIFNITR